MTESFPDRICLRNPGCVQELAEKPVSSGALESRTALHCFAFLCSAGLEQPWRAARWVETGSRPNPPTEAGADSLLPILTILGKVTWYSKYQLTLFTKKLVEIAQMVKPLSFQNWIFYKKQLRNQHCCTMKRDLHRIQHYITTQGGLKDISRMNWITCTNLRYDRWICLYIFLIEPALSDLFVSVLVILFLSILLCYIPKSTFSAFLLSKTCNANAILAYVSLASVDASITFNNILHSILSVIFCFLWCSFFILSDGPDGAASWTELKLFVVLLPVHRSWVKILVASLPALT